MIDVETVAATEQMPARVIATERTGDGHAISFAQFVMVGEQRLELTEAMLLGYPGEAAERRTDPDAIPHTVRETLEARGYEIVDGARDDNPAPREEVLERARRLEELEIEREVEVRLPESILQEAVDRYLASDSGNFEDFALDYVTLDVDWHTEDGEPIDPEGAFVETGCE